MELFWGGAHKKNHRVADQERDLSSVRSGGHVGVGSLWPSDLRRMASEGTILPALSQGCHGPHAAVPAGR